jgi:methyl-accepting chemotaxis protein
MIERVTHRLRYLSLYGWISLLTLAAGIVFGITTLIQPGTRWAFVGLMLVTVGHAASLYLRPPPPAARVLPFAVDLGSAVEQLSQTAERLTVAVQAINDVTAQQASGAREQADLIPRMNTVLDEFLELSQSIQEQGRSLTGLAKQAAEGSSSGQTAIKQAIDGMTQIRTQVSAIATTILALAQFTQRIDDIISSVSEIATQSNLLALNASIEAARAGTHGRGFAVVADEVRSLSQQSTQAAKQVRAILSEVQAAMKETIRATEEGLQGVDAGVTMTQQADQIMVQLAANVNTSHQAVNRVYEIIREQANNLEEISIGMERIDRITRQNVTSTRSVETVAMELTQLARELQIAVEIGDYSADRGDNDDDQRKQNAGKTNRHTQQHSPP